MSHTRFYQSSSASDNIEKAPFFKINLDWINNTRDGFLVGTDRCLYYSNQNYLFKLDPVTLNHTLVKHYDGCRIKLTSSENEFVNYDIEYGYYEKLDSSPNEFYKVTRTEKESLVVKPYDKDLATSLDADVKSFKESHLQDVWRFMEKIENPMYPYETCSIKALQGDLVLVVANKNWNAWILNIANYRKQLHSQQENETQVEKTFSPSLK